MTLADSVGAARTATCQLCPVSRKTERNNYTGSENDLRRVGGSGQFRAAMLFPAGATSTNAGPYYYRFYSASNADLGVSSADSNVYYLRAGTLQNVGPLANWLVTAGCR